MVFGPPCCEVLATGLFEARWNAPFRSAASPRCVYEKLSTFNCSFFMGQATSETFYFGYYCFTRFTVTFIVCMTVSQSEFILLNNFLHIAKKNLH